MKKWHNKRVDVQAIPEMEFARLAAFIDGEGCFMITPSGSGHRKYRYCFLRLVIGQADVRLMEWLFDTFGGRYEKGSGGTNRPMYYWMMEAAYMIEVLKRCMPYFILKGAQAEIFLQYRSTLTKGRTALSDEVIAQREELKTRLHLLKHVKEDIA